MKKVVYNTWPAAFFVKGGGEVQLEESVKSLANLGFEMKPSAQGSQIMIVIYFINLAPFQESNMLSMLIKNLEKKSRYQPFIGTSICHLSTPTTLTIRIYLRKLTS